MFMLPRVPITPARDHRAGARHAGSGSHWTDRLRIADHGGRATERDGRTDRHIAPRRGTGSRRVDEADILIVEDEPDIAELIRFHVEREGFRSRVVGSGKLALDEIGRQRPALLILDLMLPDLDGLEVCRRLKWDTRTRTIPILVVSAKGEESDIVSGLELGADDYVTKPFSPKVLLARLKNIMRRYEVTTTEPDEDSKQLVLGGGDLVIDIDRHRVTVRGQSAEMTPTEFCILKCLALRPGFVKTRDQIIAAVHGQTTVLSSRTVDVHVTAIRRKLGELGEMLQTVRGVGYRLAEMASERVE